MKRTGTMQEICPHCQHLLTDTEVRTLWATRNGKRQTPHAGPGRPKSRVATDAELAEEDARIRRAKSRAAPASTGAAR